VSIRASQVFLCLHAITREVMASFLFNLSHIRLFCRKDGYFTKPDFLHTSGTPLCRIR
jgi:hypothetical protein